MSLQQIIDRRLSGKNKSIGNRERFLRRHKEQIREAVKRAVDGRGIRDMERGEDVHIPKRDLSEPVFGHGDGGIREVVRPGNQEYVKGDRIAKPKGGQGGGSGGGQASDSGEGEDDFVFHLSKEEFMQVFFDDLALPNLARTTLADTPEWRSQRAGFVSDGTPTNLHVVRSMRGALGRRIALGMDKRRELHELEAREQELLKEDRPETQRLLAETRERIAQLRARLDAIPFLDPIDLRFRNRVRVPVPTSKAVMFCLMDVSGSMDQATKDMAKRFYILLYLFLSRTYKNVEVVYIRHHTQAKEVDEQEFFYSQETGGTIVSSALKLMNDVVEERYDPAQWNIYAAQASDGDNWADDSPLCHELLAKKLLPMVRYYSYIEITRRAHQTLWREYEDLQAKFDNFAMQHIREPDDIYPVFRELFRKQTV